METRTTQLGEAVRILTGDFAFKTAIATRDVPTIESVLQNHGSRVGADVMMLVDLDHGLVAESRAIAAGSSALPETLRVLLREAGVAGSAAGAGALAEDRYQLLVLPVAWIVTGFAINDSLARELSQFTRLEVSFVPVTGDGPRRVIASSLPAKERVALGAAVAGRVAQQTGVVPLQMAGDEYLGPTQVRGKSEPVAIFAVLGIEDGVAAST